MLQVIKTVKLIYCITDMISQVQIVTSLCGDIIWIKYTWLSRREESVKTAKIKMEVETKRKRNRVY